MLCAAQSKPTMVQCKLARAAANRQRHDQLHTLARPAKTRTGVRIGHARVGECRESVKEDVLLCEEGLPNSKPFSHAHPGPRTPAKPTGCRRPGKVEHVGEEWSTTPCKLSAGPPPQASPTACRGAAGATVDIRPRPTIVRNVRVFFSHTCA